MFSAIAAFMFRLSGWRLTGAKPDQISKAVWVGAPHTTNWDFAVCVGGRAMLNMEIGFLAKSQLFKWYSGWLFRALGCYPVYRHQSNNLVEAVARMFDQHEKLHIAITPEGTRKDVDRIKTGFYHIALMANVPVILIGLDYSRKAIVISEPIVLENDFDKDMKRIYDFFLTISGKRKTWLINYEKTGLIEKHSPAKYA
jgi:1-acyl-sn-glycerol-3-phosphate acyltransferase